MAVQEALGQKLEELRRRETERKRAKVEAFKRDYSADDVSLDQVNGFEVVVLDKQYVVLELVRDRENLKAGVSGPGQGEYRPGRRWLMMVKARSNGDPELMAYEVQDLEEMARLALLQGVEFDERTSSMEMVLSLDKDVLWMNILNR